MVKKMIKIKKYAMRDISLGEVNEESRTARFTFMTETPCDNWFVPESCLCERENCDLKRFDNGVMPLLFNHNRDVVIGKINSVSFDNKRAVAEVVFDADEETDKIFKKVLSGSLRGVSVGYCRLHTVRVNAGMEYRGVKYEQTTDVTDLWQPYEVSIVSCPADPDCGVGREVNQIEMEIKESEEKAMEKDVKDTAIMQDSGKVAEDATIAERNRISDIYAVCRKFNVAPEKVESYIKDAKTVDAVRKAILDDMADAQKPAKVVVEKDAGDKFIERAVDGLALHHGIITEEEAIKGADEYRNGSLRAIAEDCLVAGGMSERELRHMSAHEVFEEMFNSHSRAMGTEQFATVVDNFGNKTMLKGYNEIPVTFKALVSKGSNKDFKPTYKYRLGLDGTPELMPPESSEFKYQSMADERVAAGIQTYGKAISFTREIFINDDMGAVVKAIRSQAAGFRRLQEQMFYNVLVNGITYNTTTHKNLAANNLTITAKAYAEMRTLMRKQQDAEKKGYVGVFPKFVVASDEYGYQHEQLLVSAADPASSNSGVANIMRGKMSLITSPYLSGKAYYFVANPAELEGVEYTTLNNVDRPYSRTVIPQNHLGIDYQFWMDFGFNLIDYRAFVKNAGTNIS